jgi:hypothetical protein
MKIRCDVHNCSHNKTGACYANCVGIVGSTAKQDGETACSSFLHEMTYGELTNNIYSSGSSDCLTCTVGTCTYNENRTCNLGDIHVGGQNIEYYTQTNCLSFKPKK